MRNRNNNRNENGLNCLERNITIDKENIIKGAVFIGASAVVFGLGTYGAVTVTKGLIERITSGESLTVRSYFGTELQKSGISLSAIAMVLGGIGLYKNTKNTIESVKELKKDKKRYANIKGLYEDARSLRD